MNTIEALQKLYVALGGNAADVANLNINPEMISAIADVVEGGGLPAVTSDDNGKLLTVVEGGWNKADAPKELPALESGTTDNGKILTATNGQWIKGNRIVPKTICRYVVDATDPSSPSVTYNDKEFSEVASIVESGTTVAVGKVEALGKDIYLPEVVVEYAEGTSDISAVTFCGIGMLGSSPVYVSVSQTALGCYPDIIPLAVASS